MTLEKAKILGWEKRSKWMNKTEKATPILPTIYCTDIQMYFEKHTSCNKQKENVKNGKHLDGKQKDGN